MRKSLFTAVFLLLFLCTPRLSLGWIDSGHKIVALIAWDDLSPKAKEAIGKLLQDHPQYEKYLIANLPSDADSAAKDRYAFATAATWPDLVRAPTNPMNHVYNKPNWHFIDIPFFNGYADPSTRPAVTPEVGADGEPTNAIEALAWAEKRLKDPSIKASDRAIALCWIEHIVGDIHQPLHAATMYSSDYPKGDKGGNDEWIEADPPYANTDEALHLYWDKLPGDYKSALMDGYVAAGVRADPQFSRESLKTLLAVKDEMGWARESHELAVSQVYKDGHLEAAKVDKGRRPERGTTVPGLPTEYAINAEHVAAHQVAIGGYRLADLLNGIFESADSTAKP